MTAPEMQTAQDSGSFAAFYSMMLHIDDDDLDVYEYRLLGHYRKICGLFKSETCTESVETTAKASRMSVAKVRAARNSLEAKGRIKTTENDGRSINVRIVNCMAENLKRYSENPYQKREGYQKRNPSRIREIRTTKSDSSDLSNPIADIRIEESEEVNTKTLAPASPAPAPTLPTGHDDKRPNPVENAQADGKSDALKEVPKSPPGSDAPPKPKRQRKPKADVPPPAEGVLEAIAVLCYGTKEALDMNTSAIRGAYNKIVARGQPVTIEDLRGFYVWWKRNDWRGRKGDKPNSPYLVASLWASFKEGVTDGSTEQQLLGKTGTDGGKPKVWGFGGK